VRFGKPCRRRALPDCLREFRSLSVHDGEEVTDPPGTGWSDTSIDRSSKRHRSPGYCRRHGSSCSQRGWHAGSECSWSTTNQSRVGLHRLARRRLWPTGATDTHCRAVPVRARPLGRSAATADCRQALLERETTHPRLRTPVPYVPGGTARLSPSTAECLPGAPFAVSLPVW